ncbi:MAG: type V CRISPR-associated protein Cas12a/Cpf1 [Candidatus Omnitrophica bacterium]|nr:type V CRISPR-associated protein Cas12a/Cpf1 [Candidatus Omnitrophota bacterium]
MKNFTKQYPVAKTLRFELRPVGKDGELLDEIQASALLSDVRAKDDRIKRAYIALKPVLDKIHEDVINVSLNSEQARKIDFSDYYGAYKSKTKLEDKEMLLRTKIVETFNAGVEPIIKKAGTDGKGKKIFKKKDIKCLSESGILKYIKYNIDYFVSDKLPKNELLEHLESVKRSFSYFSGYNQNRENYYAKDEKATAVATRIVNDNLPKFCDNLILFSEDRIIKKKKSKEIKRIPSRKEEYLNAYQFLKDKNKITQIETNPIDKALFNISNFSNCLSQTGINEYNKVIGHCNSLINLYNQARIKEPDFKKLEKFKTLFKQIGCGERRGLFFEIKYDTKKAQQESEDKDSDEILNLEEILKTTSDAGEKYFKKPYNKGEGQTIYHFINWLKSREDWDGVYWSKAAIDIISNKYFANWRVLKDKLSNGLQGKDKDIKKICSGIATFNKKREEQFEINDAVELSALFAFIDEENRDGCSKLFFKEIILEEKNQLIDEHLLSSRNIINLICDDMESLAKKFCDKSSEILKLTEYKIDENRLKIKEWLDIAKSLLWIVKYFNVKESKVKGNPLNSELSNMLTSILYANDVKWFDWYDAIRNYLTQKPQDDVKKNKLKLTFGNGNLLNGFVDSFSKSDNGTQYGGYLFRKKVIRKEITEYEYFLGISESRKLFRCHLKSNISNEDKSEFERLEYYQAKSTTYFSPKYVENKSKLAELIEKLVDKCVQNNSSLGKDAERIKKRDKNGEITPSKLIKNIKEIKEKKENEQLSNILHDKDLVCFLDQTIKDLKEYTSNFIERAPQLKDIQKRKYSGYDGYEQIIQDLQDIAKNNKVFHFFNVDKREWATSCDDESNPFYLFRIDNKDLNYYTKPQKNKKGIENLHTLFFRALMREYKDCNSIDMGKGDIFYREAMKDNKTIIHGANKPIYRRSDGKTESLFDHDIIKDKRFTNPKYHFHLSILLNFDSKQSNVTEMINQEYVKDGDIRILGIDRGEKHLVYYSLIDSNGKILDQNHFDLINKNNYLKAINESANKRKESRQNWQEIRNIKSLKDGYISLVVHEIIEKMKDREGNFEPTFIVLEDLTPGFKRGRQKFEQQVYQKFELALAKKLNYLVDKNAAMGEVGSVSDALQLTPPVTNYQDIEGKKQVGIMLYARANYTSVTDPLTGWRKTIYLNKGSEGEIKDQIIGSFTEIKMDEAGDYYFQYTDNNSGKEWRLWSGKDGKPLERYRFKRGEGKNERIIELHNVKETLDGLFAKFNKEESLLTQIKDGIQLSKISEKSSAWESLRFAIDLIQQIRNSGNVGQGQDDNFLQSPVRSIEGLHFDSRLYKIQENAKLPKDADANGAYNIARKGLIMYEHIKWMYSQNNKPKNSKLDLFISDQEWDLWLLHKKQWKQQLKEFALRKKSEQQSKNQ